MSSPKGKLPSKLSRRLAELRAQLKEKDPYLLAAHTAAIYKLHPNETIGEFHLPVWDEALLVSYPDFIAREANSRQEKDEFTQTLLAYYFSHSDGTPLRGEWISFSELPDGRFYDQAFQGYTGVELTRAFSDQPNAFRQAAETLGGREQPLGDLSFSFRVLPQVPLLVVVWWGDEDFPASFRILFDASVSHHLPTDVCAVLGSTLTRRLIRIHADQQRKLT